MYSTRTATVTVTYTDTLTEGPCTVCVATLSHDLSYDVCVRVGETHVHGLYMHIPCVRVTMDAQMVLRQSTAALDMVEFYGTAH